MIHVCFCLHDATGLYSKFTGTTMLSMFDNHNPPPLRTSITVHILHDNTLTPENRDKFSYVAGQYNQRVKFYNVDKLCADKIAEIWRLIPGIKNSWVSIGAFYKFFIPKVLPTDIEKCIYLDGDIIVNLDIAELWRVELGEKVLGVIPELANRSDVKEFFPLVADGLATKEDYFNSGVLLMNLNVLRGEEENIMRGIKFRGENPRQIFWDQTIWNYCFSTRTLKLPVKFDRFVVSAQAERKPTAEKKIYHYVPKPNAMQMNMRDPFNRLWMRYFMQTPWFDEPAMARLYAGFEQVHVTLKRSMINVSAIMSGKTRTFFDVSRNIEALKKMFSVRDNEQIIPSDSENSLKKLLDAMKKARGKKVFFIMVPNFPYQVLIKAGFKPSEDFVNGVEFLSEAQGVPLNSYPLIKAM